MGDPDVTEVGLMLPGRGSAGFGHPHRAGHALPVPLSVTRDYVAHVEVPGADLAVVAMGPGLDSTFSVQGVIHREKE